MAKRLAKQSSSRKGDGCLAPDVRDFSVLGRVFRVCAPDEETAAAVGFLYEELAGQGPPGRGLEIDIRRRDGAKGRFDVAFGGEHLFAADGLGALLHELDNHVTMALEHAEPSYYFVHAAALADAGRATILVGDSGAGKSTTTYGLAASGMTYLSDELAPIDPKAIAVHPYPRAICLKQDPPPPLSLPPGHLRTERGLYVRPREVAPRVEERPVPLGRIIFVRYSPQHARASMKPVSRGEAAVRLYKGALNQLAHPSFGLDDTLRLVQHADCFELLSASIEETVLAVRGSAG